MDQTSDDGRVVSGATEAGEAEQPIWSTEALIGFTRAGDPEIRAWAIARLARQEAAALDPIVVGLLDDGDDKVRKAALEALEARPLAEAVPRMRRLIDVPVVPPAQARLVLRVLAQGSEIDDEELARWGEVLKQDPLADDPEDAGRLEAGALAADPDALRRLAPEALDATDPDRARRVLDALALQTGRWATRLVLDHLDPLLRAGLAVEVWRTLAALGDPAAFEAALDEYRPGETQIGDVLLRLEMLGGDAGAKRIPQAVRDQMQAEDAAQRREFEQLVALLRQSPKGSFRILFARQPIKLELRCDRCGRSYTYAVPEAMVHPERERCLREGWDGVTLTRVIACKRCGAEDAYTVTERGMSLLLSRLLLARAPGKDGKTPPPDEEAVVSLQIIRLWDGTEVRRPSQALAKLRAHAEAHPTDAASWRRLGNYAWRCDRRDEAAAALRRALDVNDQEIDAAYTLALILKESTDPHAAGARLGLARRMIERLPAAELPDQGRLAIAEEAVAILREALGRPEPLGLMASWELRRDKQRVVDVSSVDLRKVHDWQALAELLAWRGLRSARLTSEVPAEEPTKLQLVLDRLVRRDQVVRAQRRVGRNDPCPCGSGKKYKRCCGAT